MGVAVVIIAGLFMFALEIKNKWVGISWFMFTIGTICCLAECIPLGVAFFVVFLGMFAYGIYQSIQQNKEWEKIQAVVQECVSFDTKTNTLTLTKRGPELRYVIKVEDDYIDTIAHSEDEYIYTSVTNGGFTRGGVTHIPGRDYVASSKKSGKSLLVYKNGEKTELIKEIKIDKGLIDVAKQSSIAQYMSGDTIKMFVYNGLASSAFKMTKSAMLAETSENFIRNMAQTEARDAFPTPEKCNAI